MNDQQKTPVEQPETYELTEVVALFHDADKLEAAIDKLLEKVIDRLDFSLLATDKAVIDRLGHRYQSVKELEDDPDAPRKTFVGTSDLAEGKAALVGGLVYLGAVTR